MLLLLKFYERNLLLFRRYLEELAQKCLVFKTEKMFPSFNQVQ